jgi:hypothetical protein
MPDVETELELYKQYSVTLDGTGAGTISDVGPVNHGERWVINATQTAVPASVAQSRLSIFWAGLTAMVEGTYSANMDNTNTIFELMAGRKLYYVYSGGDAGVVATITLRGKLYLAGKRAY